MRLEGSLAVWAVDGVRGSLAVDVLACLRCSAAEVLFSSQVAALSYREERHPMRS